MTVTRSSLGRSGVTLVEMLVVVSILAILAVMFRFAMTRLQVQSRTQAVSRMFHLVDESLTAYRETRDGFPELAAGGGWVTIDALYRELLTVPAAREILAGIETHWGQPAPAAPVIGTEDRSDWPAVTDPWGRPLDYRWQRGGGDTFPLLRSPGPDGRRDTDDDIYNR